MNPKIESDAPEIVSHQTSSGMPTSNTASHQHQQEQEMLSSFAVPNPPVSTQQSSLAAEKDAEFSAINPPRTLWMGDLDPWLDEQGIADLWWQMLHKTVTVKIIKPKLSKPEMNYQGLTHSGYCFVEFESFDDAQQALALNGQLLPDMAMPSQQSFPNNPDNQKKYFRLNWASGATLTAPIIQTPEYSLFVGDLSASTTEAHLLALFQKKFPTTVKTVRVMTDPVSGKSRCFGFVRFTDEADRQRALIEMNGVWFGGRPLRVALATPRNQNKMTFHQNQIQQNQQPFYGQQQFYDQQQQQQQDFFMPPMPRQSPYFYGNPQMQPPPQPPFSNEEGENSFGNSPKPNSLGGPVSSPLPPGSAQGQPFTDPNNTTVFVGGLSSEITESTLFTLFKPFGVIQQVKIPPGKNCGFIKYSTREEAEEAIGSMQGFIIGGNRVRLSWGRVSINNKKFHQQQAAQAAQMQAAAAMSMGMDPARAMAAAAAAAAGGYPPPMHGGMPPMGMPMPPPGMLLNFNQPMPYPEGAGGEEGAPGPGEGPLDKEQNEMMQSFNQMNISKNYGDVPPEFAHPQSQPQSEVYGQNMGNEEGQFPQTTQSTQSTQSTQPKSDPQDTKESSTQEPETSSGDASGETSANTTSTTDEEKAST